MFYEEKELDGRTGSISSGKRFVNVLKKMNALCSHSTISAMESGYEEYLNEYALFRKYSARKNCMEVLNELSGSSVRIFRLMKPGFSPYPDDYAKAPARSRQNSRKAGKMQADLLYHPSQLLRDWNFPLCLFWM